MKRFAFKSSTGQKKSKSHGHKSLHDHQQVAAGANDDGQPDFHQSPKSRQSPDTSASLFSMRSFNAELDLPIVYADSYNISMLGLELLHQFDTKKYSKMAEYLSNGFLDTQYARYRLPHEPQDPAEESEENPNRLRKLRYLKPMRPVNRAELGIHHKADYVSRIHNEKSLIAKITEIWLINLVPLFTIERRLLDPIKWQIAGTIFAIHLAMQHGWAINLGGGFHQSSASSGETFCLLSDICLAMKYVWRKHPLQKFLIIDCDAHQATGVERDLVDLESKRRKMVYMLDVFNNSIQPPDEIADKGIDLRIELGRFTSDETYMRRLKDALATAFGKFKPTLVIYVAGQDVLKDDALGLMNLSDEALKKRDEMIFSWATERQRCPILMLLGGGYLARGSKVQADSIRNLYAKGLIWGGHRSGTRSLSRPRLPNAKNEKQLHGKKSNESAASINSESAPAAKSHKSHKPTGKTEVVRVAPVGWKFVTKKLPEEEKGKKTV